MTRLLRLLLISLTCATAPAVAAEPAILWVNDPGGVSVAVGPRDAVYTARWDYSPAGDIYLARRNKSGKLIWEARFDNTDSTRHEVATWVGVDAHGDVFVSGTIRSGFNSSVDANAVLMKFSGSGQLLWRKVLDLPFAGSSSRKLIVDKAGNCYVFGLGAGPEGLVSAVRKFAPDGRLRWSWFDSAGLGLPLNVKWSADGDLLLIGRGLSGAVNGFAKLDTQGQLRWSRTGVPSLTAGDAAGDLSGRVYLINGRYPQGMGSVLARLDATGHLEWEQIHTMSGLRVEVGPDTLPVIGGLPAGPGAAFAKFSDQGVLLWENLDADGPLINMLAHAQMVIDGAGNTYLAGSTLGQMAVTKIQADGRSAWTVQVGYGYAQGLALGHRQRVFVTGGQTARIDSPPPLARP